MTLHEAIIVVLKQKGRSMSVDEITDELNISSLFKRSDGENICKFQVHSRSFNHPEIFIKKGKMIHLIERSEFKTVGLVKP